MSKILTNDDFIKKSIKIHGDKYDYSKIEYINAHSKVIVICSEHGEFLITPTNHLSKRGCPRCAGNFNLTTDEFIKKSKEIHGDKYDYSLASYNGIYHKVLITCPHHGVFRQTARGHLKGYGCDKCARTKQSKLRRGSTEKFIEKARKIYGDKYDYSKVKYINSKIKIKIICPKCGEFEQAPSNHLTGYECPKCVGRYKTTQEFIIKAQRKHGYKYDYSKTKYINSKTKVIIICPEHGEFSQRATDHYKSGCPKCGGTKQSNKDEFIKKAIKIHGNKYNYSKVNYVNNRTKVTIICPIHGDFDQQPTKHITDQNRCPKCSGHGFIYLSFNDAKKFVQSLGLKTQDEYKQWWIRNKDYCHSIGIPYAPFKTYR